MSYWSDGEFRDRILALLTRDRKFLRKLSGKLVPKDFEAKTKDGPEGWARQWVATETLRYWKDYRQPIGGLIRTFALDFVRENKKKIGSEQREALFTLLERLKNPELSVGVEAIQEKILKYKERQVLREAVEEMLAAQENGGLQIPEFREIVARVMNKAVYTDKVTDYEATLERRIRRREEQSRYKYPLLYIDCFDKATRTIPRGQIGLVLAPYKRGKSAFMCHLTQAYAMQGKTTVLFTLEDPESLVEDRLDASLCGLRLSSLPKQENKLRKRFYEAMEAVRAKIFLVDATGGGWTIQRMVETVDNIRNKGIPVDCVLIDYDEHVEWTGQYKGEHAQRLGSKEIWMDFTQWAARDDIWGWMAAQAAAVGDKRAVLEGDDSAEDKSKARRVGIALGIGGAWPGLEYGDNGRWLQIMAHRFGRSRVGWPIVGDFERGIFYDRELSLEAQQAYDEKMIGKKGSSKI